MQPVVYHGLGASSDVPNQLGLRVSESGPKISDIRKSLGVLRTSFIGDEPIYVLVGPLDDATAGASDALLKSLEELPGDRRLVLWARDESKISDTVRSRCHLIYIPPKESELNEEAEELLEAYSNQDIPAMVELTTSEEIIPDFVKVLSKKFDLGLWVELRSGLQDRTFVQDDLLALLLRGIEF